MVGDVTESRFEATRLRLLQVQKPLDELTQAEVEELFGRAAKYASTIRFFDYRMIAVDSTNSEVCCGNQVHCGDLG